MKHNNSPDSSCGRSNDCPFWGQHLPTLSGRYVHRRDYLPPSPSRNCQPGNHGHTYGPLSMQDNLLILSVNMNRQPDALLTLLEATDTHILLIQEPSWGQLVPKKSDNDLDGIEVKGTCRHPRWRTILPTTSTNDPDPYVTVFLQTDLTNALNYSVLTAFNSYSCLGL